MALSTIPSLTPSREQILIQNKLRQGEILVSTRPYQPHGGAVTATAYIPIPRQELWQHLTNYPRWSEFFPDIYHSEILTEAPETQKPIPQKQAAKKQIFQKARKAFLVLSVEVEIKLCVHELQDKAIIFAMEGESSSFHDFSAELQLKDFHGGTQLSYGVQATSKIPVPALLIEQAMKIDLPMNMRHLRHVLLMGA